MKALRIAGWSRFEKSDHKKCKNMAWVATPTSHDGIGFLRLLTSPEGLRRYGGWHLILQVAAKCPTHGLLVSDSGRPVGAAEIALKTRASEADISDAIQACCEIGWLEVVDIPGSTPEDSGEIPESSGESGDSSCLQDKTRQYKTGQSAAAPPPARQPEPPEPGLFDPWQCKPPGEPPAVSRALDRRTFADWRIMVGKRCFVGQDERAEWQALYAAEGWDSMSEGYAILAERHPEPAKLFLSMFQEIRE